jgi:flagellar biosynthesis protein FliR
VLLGVQGDLVMAFLLATVRAGAWLAVSPPFSGRSVPGTVKAMLAMALALPMATPGMRHVPDPELAPLLSAVLVQTAIGVALGFITLLIFQAIQSAGDLIDLFGGFSLSQAFDPLSMSQNSVFGRLHGLLAVVLLFTTSGHLIVLRGFMSTYDILPLDAGLDLHTTLPIFVSSFGTFFLDALQIAGPLIGVLFLSDVGLGLLNRVSPSLNAFSLGFPLKIMLTLVLVGLTFPLLPGTVTRLAELSTRALLAVAGG